MLKVFVSREILTMSLGILKDLTHKLEGFFFFYTFDLYFSCFLLFSLSNCSVSYNTLTFSNLRVLHSGDKCAKGGYLVSEILF